MQNGLSVVDLFAGIGGFSLGFLRANKKSKRSFNIRLLVDMDPSAAFSFKKNFPWIPYLQADLFKISGNDLLALLRMKPGELDFLIGGPPCQGFSASGKRWLKDNRNLLMSRFIQFAVLQKGILFTPSTCATCYGTPVKWEDISQRSWFNLRSGLCSPTKAMPTRHFGSHWR